MVLVAPLGVNRGSRPMSKVLRPLSATRIGSVRCEIAGSNAAVRTQELEPMAAVTAPARTAAQHQPLAFRREGGWSDERFWARGAR